MKVIITGVTGMVGEGVLLQCLASTKVTEVLSASRKPCGKQHPKLKELIISDFFQLSTANSQLAGYDACFYCAGISSVGMSEADYTRITFDTTLHFANLLLHFNPQMTFHFISGASTDDSEQGKVMWARVKGKTENALRKMTFSKVFCYRPGLMKPAKEQQYLKGYNKYARLLYPLFSLFMTGCPTRLIGQAMINIARKGYIKNVLTPKDILMAAQ